MKYLIYVILLYIFLPFNYRIDLITILIFFIIFNEDDRFVLIFSFLAGLLIDLYNPIYLGLNILTYTVLAQLVLYIKKYIAQDLLTVFGTFTVFYLTKTIIIHLALSSPLKIQLILITIITFLPVFLVLNRMRHGVWKRV